MWPKTITLTLDQYMDLERAVYRGACHAADCNEPVTSKKYLDLRREIEAQVNA